MWRRQCKCMDIKKKKKIEELSGTIQVALINELSQLLKFRTSDTFLYLSHILLNFFFTSLKIKK